MSSTTSYWKGFLFWALSNSESLLLVLINSFGAMLSRTFDSWQCSSRVVHNFRTYLRMWLYFLNIEIKSLKSHFLKRNAKGNLPKTCIFLSCLYILCLVHPFCIFWHRNVQSTLKISSSQYYVHPLPLSTVNHN